MPKAELANRENGLTALTPEAAEKLVLGGDLAGLQPAQRVVYYNAVCESVGLNPLTKPFDFITLNGRMVMYAKRECTEQLRSIKKVSITKLETTINEASGVIISRAEAAGGDGRTDFASGVVACLDGKGAMLKGDILANALMKAETKAKRRVTLSICGLGLLDESELDTIAEEVARPDTTMPTRLSDKQEEKKPNNPPPQPGPPPDALTATVDFGNVGLQAFSKKGVFQHCSLVAGDGFFFKILDPKVVDMAKGARDVKARAVVTYRVQGTDLVITKIEPV